MTVFIETLCTTIQLLLRMLLLLLQTTATALWGWECQTSLATRQTKLRDECVMSYVDDVEIFTFYCGGFVDLLTTTISINDNYYYYYDY